MSRPKVPEHQRRRIARACDTCKRRKQKCNGQKPCLLCTKKRIVCSYKSTRKPGTSDEKQEILPAYGQAVFSSNPQGGTGESTPCHQEGKKPLAFDVDSSLLCPRPDIPHNSNLGYEFSEHRQHVLNEGGQYGPSPNSTVGTVEEEAVLAPAARMLQDETGRLLYIGDSATLSYLNLFRRMVESINGVSEFTGDPYKEKIVETVISLPPNVQPPCQLADRMTAGILVKSYFANTIGLVDIFDKQRFREDFDKCYSNPLSVDNHFLCLLFLTFAIGLVTATPEPGTREEAVIRHLRGGNADEQAELFFRSAKRLGNPLNGFEDADFWSIQALSLMSVYMLSVSKRNAAFSYHGMAVRSAIALGLHRKETMAPFQGRDLKLRCSMWKTLYVLDRFISASLGRPTAINNDECTEAALQDDIEHYMSLATGYTSASFSVESSEEQVHLHGVNASVRSSHIVGTILKEVYSKRRVSAQVIRDIQQQCDLWTQNLPDCLHWQHLKQTNLHTDSNGGYPSHARTQGLAVLHVNLLHYHSIILLTRPFFLFLIQKDRRGSMSRPCVRTEKFSEICVETSYQTISMIQSAREAMCLPQRNPFVMYFLFTAALLIMSNEFVVLFYSPSYGVAIKQAISIMEYFSANDHQAARLLWILRALQDVVFKQAADGVAATGSINPSRYSYQMGAGNDSTEPFWGILARASVSTMDNSESGESSRWQDERGRNSSTSRPRVWNSFQSQGPGYPSRNNSVTAYGVGTGGQVPTPSQEPHSGPTGHFGATTVEPLSLEVHPPMTPVSSKPPTYRQQQQSDGSIYEPVSSGMTETLETETDEFDFDGIYDWSGAEGTEVGRGGSSTADTVVGAVSPFSPGTPQGLVPGANCGFQTPQSAGRVERGDRPGTLLHPPLQPVYSNYTMHMNIDTGGWNATGPSDSGTTTPHNVPLYRTTDFG